MARFDHVLLDVRAEPVLGAEDRRERPVRRSGEGVGDMAKVMVDRGGIGERANRNPLRRGEAIRRSMDPSSIVTRALAGGANFGARDEDEASKSSCGLLSCSGW